MEARRDDKPNRHGSNRPPRRISHRREDPCNHLSGTRHSPPDSVQGILRNGHSGGMPYPKTSSSAVLAEIQDDDSPVQPHSRGDEKGNSQATNDMEDVVSETDPPKMSAPQGDDLIAAGEADVTHHIDAPLEGTGDEVAHYVDNVGCGSSANPHPPRKRSAGSSVHPRNRTLSESVQAYLSRPAVPRYRYLPKKLSDEQPTATGSPTTDTRPSLLLRLTDGPDVGKLPSPHKTTVDGEPSTLDDAASEHHHSRRSQSCVFSSNHASSTATKHADVAEPGVTPRNAAAAAALSRASALADVRRASSVQTPSQSGVDDALGGRASLGGGKAASVDDGVRGRTDADILPSPSPAAAPPPSPTVFNGGKRAVREPDSGEALATLVSAPVPVSESVSTSASTPVSRPSQIEPIDVDVDMDMDMSAALEKRLRARARVRVRLAAAIKGATVGAVGSGSGLG